MAGFSLEFGGGILPDSEPWWEFGCNPVAGFGLESGGGILAGIRWQDFAWNLLQGSSLQSGGRIAAGISMVGFGGWNPVVGFWLVSVGRILAWDFCWNSMAGI